MVGIVTETLHNALTKQICFLFLKYDDTSQLALLRSH